VIGREFTRRLLDRLAELHTHTERYLQELKALELIYERSLFPELAYMFKHALIQDVTYNSLLVRRRQELHQLIGRAMEELYADRLPEQYEMLAYHFAKAEVWDKALDCLLKAAEKATQAFATREALALYGQAEDVVRLCGTEALTETRMQIHQARADLYLLRSDFERAHTEWESVLALAQDIGHPTQLWKTHLALGRWDTATQCPEHARQAQNAAHEVIDHVLAGLQEPGLRSSLTRLQQHLLL